MRFLIVTVVIVLSLDVVSLRADEPAKPVETTEDWNGVTFVAIPGGQFTMGGDQTAADLTDTGINAPDGFSTDNEAPAHRVKIYPFHMGKYEVTRGQFRIFVDATGYQTDAEKHPRGGWGVDRHLKKEGQKTLYSWMNTGCSQTDNHPVVNVSWNDAVAYCRWMTEQYSKDGPPRVCRLPTEAEWEYACRAGSVTRYATGDTPRSLVGSANVADASLEIELPDLDYSKFPPFPFRDGVAFTSVTGRYAANAFGLHDMHGNVWEWCNDNYDAKYYFRSPPNNPQGADHGNSQVLRGGSWGSDPNSTRSAYRNFRHKNDYYYDRGFRVVLESAPRLEQSADQTTTRGPQEGTPEPMPQNARSSTEQMSTLITTTGDKQLTENSIGMRFVRIPDGSFLMGSPVDEEHSRDNERQQKVTFSQAFHIGVYEVTQAQFTQVMGKNPSCFTGDKVAERHPRTRRVIKPVDSSNHPVETVTYDDAVEFCKKLSALPEEQSAGRRYRLPTEAEWEYACRAGSTAAFSFGHEASELGAYAWYVENSEKMTHAVGTKRPNAFGLFDMHGNVSEWCSLMEGDNTPGPDPNGPDNWIPCVARGGSWTTYPELMRSAYRDEAHSNGFIHNTEGFRVVLE